MNKLSGKTALVTGASRRVGTGSSRHPRQRGRPGVVETDMSNFTRTEAGREVALGMQALKRMANPDDIAPVVAFLASDDARWVTGASIYLDGGSKL